VIRSPRAQLVLLTLWTLLMLGYPLAREYLGFRPLTLIAR
jgi:hypothetical protein